MKFKFNLFNRESKKGVERHEDTTPNIAYYFKSLFRKLSKLLSVNLLAMLQFVPLVAVALTYIWADTTPSVKDVVFPVTYGIWQIDPSPVHQIVLLLSSVSLNLPILPLWKWLVMAAMVVVFALLFGWWNVGFTYLMRELVSGRPIFIFSDLKHAIKRNLKQGFFVGLIDFAIFFVLGYNIYNMLNGMMVNNFFGDFFYIANIAILVIYMVMRVYIYLMIITFDMKITKAVKNALIFVMLGFKRNILALLWIVALVVLNILLLFVYIPLGVILPFFYIVSVPLFTAVYAAYPIIQKYMIDDEETANAEEPSDGRIEAEDSGLTAEEMWQTFAAQAGLDQDVEYETFAYEKDTDQMASWIVNGDKSVTSVAHPLYAAKGMALPYVGGYRVILNANGNAVCITQTTKVYVVPFHKVTEEHVRLEGEGNLTAKAWKTRNHELFSQEMQDAGLAFDENTKIVFEQFNVVYKPE